MIHYVVDFELENTKDLDWLKKLLNVYCPSFYTVVKEYEVNE